MKRPAPEERPDLSADCFGRTLYVQMAALARVERLEFGSQSLLEDILVHEQRYWGHRYRKEIVGDVLSTVDFTDCVARLMAATTLLGRVASRQALERLADRVCGPSESAFPHVVRYLHGLYPGASDYLVALEPDLLGEKLIEQVLSHAETPDDYLSGVFEHADAQGQLRAFTILGRIAAGAASPALELLLGRLIEGSIAARGRLALEAALALGRDTIHSPLGRALYAALVNRGTLEIAAELEPLIPQDTVSLREVAVWTLERLLASTGEPPDAASIPERAARLDAFASRLSAVGKSAAALDASRESTRLYRALAQSQRDTYLPGLALALSNLANHLDENGAFDQAFQVADEAAKLHAERSEPANLGAWPGLAHSFVNLAKRFSRMGGALPCSAAGRRQFLGP